MILQTRIHFAIIITAVHRILFKRCLDLTQQGFHHRIIAHAMRGQNSGLNFSTHRVDAQMEFASCAPFRFAVRAHFPFAFAVDFQPRAIHNEKLFSPSASSESRGRYSQTVRRVAGRRGGAMFVQNHRITKT